MIDAYLKPIYQQYLLSPLLKSIKHSMLSMKIIVLLLSSLVMISLYLSLNKIAFFLLLISSYFNCFYVSKENCSLSPRTFKLCFFIDRMIEIILIFGLYLLDPINRGWLSLIMLSSAYACSTSFLLSQLPLLPNHKFLTHSGMIARIEGWVLFMLMIILPNYFNYLAGMLISFLIWTSYLNLFKSEEVNKKLKSR